MYKKNKQDAVKKINGGLTSHVLLQKSDVPESNLLITWVEVKPNASQALHQHEPEQVYVIIAGQGRITIGDEQSIVNKGDIVYVPSNALHGITNIGNDNLIYISASTPSFNIDQFYQKTHE